MGCKTCGEPVAIPFLSLYRRCYAGLEASGNKSLKVTWLMAVAVAESAGTAFGMKQSDSIQANGVRLATMTGLDKDHFLYLVQIKEAINKGLVPKFRFESSWYDCLKRDTGYSHYSEYQQAAFACSWGLGQKSGYYLTRLSPSADKWPLLRHFMLDETMQIWQIAADLSEIEQQDPGKAGLRFTRYNAGPAAKEINSYGLRVASLAADLEKQLTQKGFKVCLE